MGAAARRKARFLADNPVCCFCGGSKPSTTEDHVPARTFFRGRTWPQGFVFPACGNCNSKTRNAENLCAMLAKVARIAPSPYSNEEIEDAMIAMRRGYPAIFHAIANSESAVSYYARTGEHVPTSPEYDPDSSIVEIPGDIHAAANEFFLKLGLALHYKNTNSIFSTGGHYFVWWFSNKTILDGGIPDSVSELFPKIDQLKRGNTGVSEYFDYRWDFNEVEQLFGTFSVFGDSFGAIAVLTATPPKSEFLPWAEFRPD